jgi:hypothetical protein
MEVQERELYGRRNAMMDILLNRKTEEELEKKY